MVHFVAIQLHRGKWYFSSLFNCTAAMLRSLLQKFAILSIATMDYNHTTNAG